MTRDSKPLIVWGLYAAGISTVLTPFVGVALAYGWRRGADAQVKPDYDRQIRLFWTTGLGWALCFALIGVALFLDIRSGAPAGADKPLLFYIGLLVAILAQIRFTLVSLWHLFRTLFQRGMPMQAA